MEPAGSGATWTGSPKGDFSERKHHKPRLDLAMEQQGNVEPENYLPNKDYDSHYRMRANAP